MDDAMRDQIEAAAFRRLLHHLRTRTDVQNVDLMGIGGFCRNCLGDWVQEAAEAAGAPMSKEDARAHVYGMPQAEHKARFQTAASAEQLAAMDASVAKNRALGL